MFLHFFEVLFFLYNDDIFLVLAFSGFDVGACLTGNEHPSAPAAVGLLLLLRSQSAAGCGQCPMFRQGCLRVSANWSRFIKQVKSWWRISVRIALGWLRVV